MCLLNVIMGKYFIIFSIFIHSLINNKHKSNQINVKTVNIFDSKLDYESSRKQTIPLLINEHGLPKSPSAQANNKFMFD